MLFRNRRGHAASFGAKYIHQGLKLKNVKNVKMSMVKVARCNEFSIARKAYSHAQYKSVPY
jgi:hypothetical protein